MRPRALVTALAPLALALTALCARELRPRPRATAAPQPSGDAPLVPPLALASLPIDGAWRVLPEASAAALALDDGRRATRFEAAGLAGSARIDGGGRSSTLELRARLDRRALRALGLEPGSGALALRELAVAGAEGAVPGARIGRAEARLELDGRAWTVPCRAAWMPCGPGRLRLALELAWPLEPASLTAALAAPFLAGERATLALDLVLARS